MEKDFARHCLKKDRHYRHLHQWLTLPSWLPDGHPYQCKGEHYHRYVKRQLPPPPHSWERRPPRDARVLFYGHSYLGQVRVDDSPRSNRGRLQGELEVDLAREQLLPGDDCEQFHLATRVHGADPFASIFEKREVYSHRIFPTS